MFGWHTFVMHVLFYRVMIILTINLCFLLMCLECLIDTEQFRVWDFHE